MSKTQSLCYTALFSVLICIGAWIKVPVPPIAFSLQFLFTNLAALLLGKRYGTAAVLLYTALGLLGLPVFTGGGGIGYVLSPSFGYIIGFAAGAFFAGLIIEKGKRSIKRYLLAGFVNLFVVYLLGACYFYLISRFYLHSAVTVGKVLVSAVLIFIPFDAVCCVISAFLSNRLYGAAHFAQMKE